MTTYDQAMRPYASTTPPWGWGPRMSEKEAALAREIAESRLGWLKRGKGITIPADEREAEGRLRPVAQRPA